MYVRVVRFSGVESDRMAALEDRVRAAGGPPEGVDTTGLQVLYDADQGTAVVLQLFATAEAMAQGERVMDAMDPSETPGTRESIDRCEVRVDVSPA